MGKHLHIVSFDNPWPPDYGGVIDVYYKIKALHEAGAHIHLHLFDYGRHKTAPLQDITDKIYVYPRPQYPWWLMHHLPYIVRSRMPDNLLKNLNQNDWPVLFEGVHTTGLMSHLSSGRKKWIRIHNIEHQYYDYLSKHTGSRFHKWYYANESRKLARYEPEVWSHASMNFCLTEMDKKEVERYGRSELVPVFHPFERVEIQEASAVKYMLFHGNLSVVENERAAIFLWLKVVNPLGLHMVIAGKNPPASLRRLANKYPRLGLVANPDGDQMDRLIRGAEVHLIYSDNAAGFKLKLLYALARGRKLLVSRDLVKGTPWVRVPSVENNAHDWRERLRLLVDEKWDFVKERRWREDVFAREYHNRKNALKLLEHA